MSYLSNSEKANHLRVDAIETIQWICPLDTMLGNWTVIISREKVSLPLSQWSPMRGYTTWTGYVDWISAHPDSCTGCPFVGPFREITTVFLGTKCKGESTPRNISEMYPTVYIWSKQGKLFTVI